MIVETPNIDQAADVVAVMAWLLGQGKISDATYNEVTKALNDTETNGELEGL